MHGLGAAGGVAFEEQGGGQDIAIDPGIPVVGTIGGGSGVKAHPPVIAGPVGGEDPSLDLGLGMFAQPG